MSRSRIPGKREELVQVAGNLFYRQGYGQTGVQQIIDAAGIAKGTFYSHFSSKEAVGLAWLEQSHEKWTRQLHDALATRSGPREKLIELFSFLGEAAQNNDFRGCAFVNTLCETPDGESPLRAKIAAHKQDLLFTIRNLVDALHPEQEAEERHRLATTIFLLFEGALVATQNFRQAWPIETAKNHLCRLIQCPME